MIDLPVTYRCRTDGEKIMTCGASLPNAVNLISLGTDNIVPDPLLPGLRKAIEDSFLAVGHRVHFIDTLMFQESKGNAHCVTNVVRDPNVSVREWEAGKD